MISDTKAITPRTITGDGLLLRPLDPSDEPALGVALRDAEILRWATGLAVARTAESERAGVWLAAREEGWAGGSPVLAVCDEADGTLLGTISVRDVNRLPGQAVVGYWVTPAARGRGVATRALGAAAAWAFAPRDDGGLGLHRITLDHVLLNLASCRVAVKAGFRVEGTMRDFYVEAGGERHDSHLHARLATDTSEAPAHS